MDDNWGCPYFRTHPPLNVEFFPSWDQDGTDDDVPLQHLRAAEQHLAALERWLRGEGR